MIAKATILFAALAAVHASGLLGYGHLVNTGVSNSAQSQDAYGNYAFGYGIKDGLGATNSRSEVGDAHGNKKGSYTIADIDGRARRAPAAALIASPYAGPVAPVVNHVAPAASLVGHGASYAAPLAVAAPVAYGGVIGHGAALGLGAPLELGYGAGLGLGHRAALGLGYGAPVGLGYGLGVGKALIH
ncbi:adult-specific rigid cuticular protein 15.7 [Caerostris extrusa]|uniref:Adult-specific rigid cuticular protein 15.7 n=1 Tax=Caerostris extrusa TaxID=172846 RepID=A0AAV4TF65_CAEEX|nr:adult-specific rigid cuticular protein 15.7 [Caerostris extrusa]